MKRVLHLITSLTLLVSITTSCHVYAQSIIQATWETNATNYSTNVGQRYIFNFPPGEISPGKLWGNGVYTTDCYIASAAVHAGLITTQKGGTVTIEILPGQNSYEGSVSNGITSSDWGRFGSSFIFISDNRMHNQASSTIVYGNWVTNASEYNGKTGQRFTFYFPKGITTTGQVWGTDIYTTDCSIASAAVHAGFITPQNGGIVTIEILPGQNAYTGSTRNGVTSRDWASYTASFKFITKRCRRR